MTIQHNEASLAEKVLEITTVLNTSVSKTETKLLLRELFNQISITFLNFLTLVEDLESSLLFCHLNTLHPSIIKPTELLAELRRIERYYKEELPFSLTPDNLPYIEEIIDVRCKVTDRQLVFFLSIPINFRQDYTLFYLLPIPTLVQSEYVTVRTPHRYILKDFDDDSIIPLHTSCPRLPAAYQCSDPDSSTATTCEATILAAKTTEACDHSRVDIRTNHLEYVPESSKLLGLFVSPEHITINCPHHSEEHTIQGIYLFEPLSCSLIFQNRTIPKTLTSETKPIFFENPALATDDIPNLQTSFHFSSLNVQPEVNDLPPPGLNFTFISSHASHYWAYALFFLLVTLITIVAFYVFYKTPSFCSYTWRYPLRTFRRPPANADPSDPIELSTPLTFIDQPASLPASHVGFLPVPQS